MYQWMFYIGLTLALVFLVISIILFFRNNVAKLIGDVTGWNAKRAIKKIYEKDAEGQSEQLAFASKGFSQKTGKVERSDKIKKPSGQRNISKGPQVEVVPNQSILEAIQESSNYSAENVFQVEDEMMVLATDSGVEDLQDGDAVTTLLVDHNVTNPLTGDETSVLGEEETSLLIGDEETTLLTSEETTLLTGDEETTLLTSEETTLLAGDEETTLLTSEETALLAGDEETTLLTDDEETVLLRGEAES